MLGLDVPSNFSDRHRRLNVNDVPEFTLSESDNMFTDEREI